MIHLESSDLNSLLRIYMYVAHKGPLERFSVGGPEHDDINKSNPQNTYLQLRIYITVLLWWMELHCSLDVASGNPPWGDFTQEGVDGTSS